MTRVSLQPVPSLYYLTSARVNWALYSMNEPAQITHYR
jgi:hypothetical protein